MTDLERLQVTYARSDRFRMTAGRIHNPLVLWNVEQHHGSYLQTSIDKPALSDWEDEPGLWPVHFVGVTVGGSAPGNLGFSWETGIGNGRGSVLDEVQTSRDLNSDKAILARMDIAPNAFEGWSLGAALYLDEIPAASGPIQENDLSVSVSYLSERFEMRSEWSRMEHDPDSSDSTYETEGWYVLLSAALPGRFAAVRPYLLVDNLDVAEGEEFLQGAADEEAYAIGLRWDVRQSVAVKFDFRSEEIGAGRKDELVRAQIAFGF